MGTTSSIIKAVTDSKLAIVIHRKGEILFVNQVAIEMFGATSMADVAGKNIDSFVDPSFLSKIHGRRTLFEAGEPLEPVEGALLRLDGKPFESAITSFEIVHEGDKASLSIIIDIDRAAHQDTEIEMLGNQIRQLMTIAVGREVRMEELKKIIEKLKRKPNP